MGIKVEAGFTIIETMLFLAVTGLLASVILVGSGVSINQQRYRDSVNSLKSYIQEQYSNVLNVSNDRTKGWSCDSAGNITQTDITVGEARGTSNCVLLGRYITIDDAGTTLKTADVIGARRANAPIATSDIAEIATNYQMTISPISQDTTDVGWHAQVVKPRTTIPMPLTILIIRSPLSGSILTFTTTGVQTLLNGLVLLSNMNQARDLCVNANAGSFVGRRLEVQISAFAADQSGVQVPPESSSVCD